MANACFLRLSVLDGNVGLSKDFLAHGLCVENPIGLLANFLDPFVALKARLCPENLLKPLFFADDLDHVVVEELLNIVFTVLITVSDTCTLRHIEDVPSCEFTDLEEYRDEIFIASGDLCVVLKSTILKNTVESVGLVNGLSTAV